MNKSLAEINNALNNIQIADNVPEKKDKNQDINLSFEMRP